MNLKELSNRLKVLRVQSKTVKIIEKPLQIMFFNILYDIAKAQAPDTSQGRMNIIMRCAEKLGMEYLSVAEKLIESWNFWESHGFPENKNRSPDNLSESSIEMENGIFKWSTTDMAIIEQENGREISKIHPRSNSGLYTNHITVNSFKYDAGFYNNIIDKHIEIYINNYIDSGVIK